MMPGEPNVRPWVLIYYREDDKRRDPEKYWNDTGKDLYNSLLKPALKANNEIKQAAAGAVEGASSDEQKVLATYLDTFEEVMRTSTAGAKMIVRSETRHV